MKPAKKEHELLEGGNPAILMDREQPAANLKSLSRDDLQARESPVWPIPVQPRRVAQRHALLPFDGTDDRAAEQYRLIRTKIAQHPKQPRTLLVTSPSAGEGKTVTAVNIAGALSLGHDIKALLVSGDLRSNIASMLRLPAAPGLSDVLAGDCSLEESIVATEQFANLHVLPAGTSKPNLPELLDSPQSKVMIAELRNQFGFTIIDGPPVGVIADYYLLQAASDGVLLVVRPDYTNRRLLEGALGMVPKDKFLGVVLNSVEDWFLWKVPNYKRGAIERD